MNNITTLGSALTNSQIKSNAEAYSEIESAITLAQRFPRDIAYSWNYIKNYCGRLSFAEKALYSYPRGGQVVTGISIRLAEVIAQAWKHITYGYRVLESYDNKSIVQATAWDLQNNIKPQIIFEVPHFRYKKQGSQLLLDPRDVYEHVANYAARRVRKCILQLIPLDIQEEAQEECDMTLKNNIQITPDKISKLIDAFAAYGITVEMIEKRLRRNIESMNHFQFIDFRKIFNSLKEGMSTPSMWFEVEKSIAQKNNDAELKENNDLFEQFKTAIDNSKSIEELELIGTDVSIAASKITDQQRKELRGMYEEKLLKIDLNSPEEIQNDGVIN